MNFANRHRWNHCPGRRSPRGLTLIELTIAVAVLAVLLSTSMKMLFVASNQLRANEKRIIGLQVAQAVSEQIENIPWEQLTPEAASRVAIPALAAARLPGAKLNVTVSDETDPAAKRVVVQITWNARNGQKAAPMRLTTWVFPENDPQTP